MSEPTPGEIMPPTIQPAKTGLGGVVWSIMGQTYTPLQHSESSMAWHAVLPPGTFVPPHSHAAQEEFVHVLSGTLDLDSGGATRRAGPGDLLVLPRHEPHGLYNRGDTPVECLFWVAPSARLWELFTAIDGVPDPAEIVRLAALHDVTFLPPPG